MSRFIERECHEEDETGQLLSGDDDDDIKNEYEPGAGADIENEYAGNANRRSSRG